MEKLLSVKVFFGLFVIITAALLLRWSLGEQTMSAAPADFSVEDVIASLPSSDTIDCEIELGEFVSAPDVLGPHMEGAIGAYEGELFLISGFSHYLQKHLLTSPRVDRRPAGQEQWVPVPQQAPTNASHIQSAIQGPMLWLAGGFVGDSPGRASDKVWRYDMQNDVWAEGPSLPWGRASGGFVAQGGLLHYIGGLKKDRETDISEHLILDPDAPDGWRLAAVFPRPRNHFQAVSLGGFIYAVGGMTSHGKSRADVAHLDVYHPEYAQWRPMADMPETRSHSEMATFVYKDRIVVVGGRTEGKPKKALDSVVAYNPYKNRWRRLGRLPQGLYGGHAFVDNDRLYVGGGGRIWREPSIKSWSAPIGLACN